MFSNFKNYDGNYVQRSLAEINSNLRAMSETQFSNQAQLCLQQSSSMAPNVFQLRTQNHSRKLQPAANRPPMITNIYQERQTIGRDVTPSLHKPQQPINERYARLAFAVHPDMGYSLQRHSDINLREWNRSMTPRLSRDILERKYGSCNERIGDVRDVPFTDRFSRDCESIRLTSHSSDVRARKSGNVPPITIDDPSTIDSTPSGSITSSVGSSIYPKSRRVNFLCASLHFIQDLDLINLSHALDQVRQQMKQLCRNQRGSN